MSTIAIGSHFSNQEPIGGISNSPGSADFNVTTGSVGRGSNSQFKILLK